MIMLSTGDILAILTALVALIVGIIAFMRQHPQFTPAQLDSTVVTGLSDFQSNREVMDRLERAYQNSGDIQKHALEALVSALHLVAPLTPIASDDAAVAVLDDITQPGAPAVIVTAPTPPAADTLPPANG